MSKFTQESFEKEMKYIWDKYLGKEISVTSEFEEIPERMTKVCNAVCNGKEYKLYKSFMHITLIPVGLIDLSDDFDSIIQYGQNEMGCSISTCKRKAGKVEIIKHSFLTNENSDEKTRVTSDFISYDDENNVLHRSFQEEGVSLDLFVIRNSHLKTPKDFDTFTVNIVRNETSTRWNSGIFDIDTITTEKIDEFFSYPNNANDNDTPMIQLSEEINRKAQDVKESKINKKA